MIQLPRNLGVKGWMLKLTGLASIVIAILDFTPLVNLSKDPILRCVLLALGFLMEAVADQIARQRESDITGLHLAVTKLPGAVSDAVRDAIGSVDVQLDRRSNYERGAELLYSVSRTEKVTLSFLEHSSMWGNTDQDEDTRFDDALTHAIKSSQCDVEHVIRCDRSADLPEIQRYVQKYHDAPNYSVYVMTRIDYNFPPLDVLVLSGRVAQIEFPQLRGNLCRMGPSIVVPLPNAVSFVEEYARILVANSICIKNAHGFVEENVNKLKTILLKTEKA